MADFDPCECIFSHTGAMNRLLRMLQNAQNACTDGECTDGTLDDADATNTGTAMAMVAAWALFAAGMYMMRPTALRGSAGANTIDKPGPADGSGAGEGPQPPAPTA